MQLRTTDMMRRYRTAIVHGISTVGKTHLGDDHSLLRKLKNSGIDLWDTDRVPQLIYGSYSSVHHMQGPVEPERSRYAADAFDELFEYRIQFVKRDSSMMLVTTNNAAIIERWRDLVLCSFTRPRDDVVLARMEREGLDRHAAESLMRGWRFHLPEQLAVPEVTLKREEYLSDYLDTIIAALRT